MAEEKLRGATEGIQKGAHEDTQAKQDSPAEEDEDSRAGERILGAAANSLGSLAEA